MTNGNTYHTVTHTPIFIDKDSSFNKMRLVFYKDLENMVEEGISDILGQLGFRKAFTLTATVYICIFPPTR